MSGCYSLKDLERALSNDEFVYYYQPKVCMVTGEVCGTEALIRWQKPDCCVIRPSAFIPLAESSGLINDITLSMFQKLLIDKSIIHDNCDKLTISFNASAKDFLNNKLTEAIEHAINNHLISPDKLEIELTETVVLDEMKDVRDKLFQIQELGILLTMDDFGAGYSNINRLSKWPFSTIKLDTGLVGKISFSKKNLTIAQSSIMMAHQLGLDVVAEGIETENIYMTLHNIGCTQAQGCWISHPLPLFDFIEFIKLNRSWPTVATGSLYMAQLDHIQWRKTIIDTIFSLCNGDINELSQLRETPELDPTTCRLGIWYYGSGKKYKGNIWYDYLEEAHARLHKVGLKLIESALRGTSINRLIPLMRDLTEQSVVVIQMLQEIENESITEYTNVK